MIFQVEVSGWNEGRKLLINRRSTVHIAFAERQKRVLEFLTVWAVTCRINPSCMLAYVRST